MGRRNTNRNRYSNRRRSNTVQNRKPTKQELEQIAITEHNKLSDVIDSSYTRSLVTSLIGGTGIKSIPSDLLGSKIGSNYNHVYISSSDIEVKCDKVMLCYSNTKRAYLWLGFDYDLNTAYILFYDTDLSNMISNTEIDNIIMNRDDLEMIVEISEELKNFEYFYNMQKLDHEIKNKSELFPELITEDIIGLEVKDLLD